MKLIFFHHVEYIHYHPVKHGLVTAPKDWEYQVFIIKMGSISTKISIKKRKFATYCLGENVTLTESQKVFFLRSLTGGSLV